MDQGFDIKDYHFDLPKELIAQTPLSERSSSRLLTLERQTGAVSHKSFRDITELVNKGDCLVINDTKVIPARLTGAKMTGGRVEVLLLNRLPHDTWEVLTRGKIKAGDTVVFGSGEMRGKITELLPNGNRLIRFEYDGIFEQVLDVLGEMPLPPYITEKLDDRDRYQTVYARENGSSAAPTAGLHFTGNLLSELSEKGVDIARITLHVGLGTFRPVKVSDITKHEMHSERYSVTEEAASAINRARSNGGRVIAVGTTSARTLESMAEPHNGRYYIKAGSGSTNIFIYPPYEFKLTDALITNFHLPESTLLMLISALAGRENVLKAYSVAIMEKYRFYSFGDAMYIY